jgi:muramidase (phage lysozyme)
MASRFVVADNDFIEELKTGTLEKAQMKTGTLEKAQIYGLEYLRNEQQLRNIGEDIETYEVEELDKFTFTCE